MKVTRGARQPAVDCDKILLMAYSVALDTVAPIPGPPLAAASPALTADEMAILTSIVEVLAPAGIGAGAGTAARIESLDRKLRGPMSRFLPAFRQGLAAMDLACRLKTDSGLPALDPGERRLFVRQLRSGHKLTAFFSLLTAASSVA